MKITGIIMSIIISILGWIGYEEAYPLLTHYWIIIFILIVFSTIERLIFFKKGITFLSKPLMYIWILIITLYCVSWIKGNPNENNEKIEKDIQKIVKSNVSINQKLENLFKQGNKQKSNSSKKIYFKEVIAYSDKALNENISPERHDYIRGLITASYFTSGQHQEGIKFLCKQYEAYPKNNHRFRHDMHAHIRGLAIRENKDFDKVENIIQSIRTDFSCDRDDLSLIWAGIPLDIMRHLEKSITEYNIKGACWEHHKINTGKCIDEDNYFSYIETDDVIYLKNLLNKKPLIKFADYGYYTLANYDKILNSFKNSYIYDIALMIKGEILRGKKEIKESSKFLDQYISLYPKGNRIKFVTELQMKNLYDLNQKKDLDDLEKKSLYINKKDIEKYECHTLYQEIYDYRYAEKFVQADNYIQEFLKNSKKCTEYREIKEKNQKNLIDLLNNGEFSSFNQNKHKQCYDFYYLDAVTMFFYKIENIVKNKNTNELQRITHSLNNCGYQRSHKKNITISICSDIIKCFGERVSFHSIVSHLYEKIYNINQDSGNLFLSSLAYKRRDNWKEYLSNLNQFLTESSFEHELKDDALTELGWYFFIIKNDFKRAEQNFKEVVINYPKSNAYDNALNWLVIMYLQNADYEKALEYSALLTKDITSKRLKKIIKGRHENIEKQKRDGLKI